MDNPLWGHLPPDIRYNRDQLTLTFVVNHDRTFTTHDDNYIHISAPSDALSTIQFTINVVFNGGEGNKHQGVF